VSEVKVNKISPRSGTDVTLGDSGDTFTVPTGVTLDTSNSTVTLPDGTVTNAKVNASAAIDYSKLNLTGNIALADLSATGTKDATTFLRGDNTFGVPPLGGITEADQWRLNADFTSNNTTINAGWERNDSTGFGYIGTGMTESSGIFTFPSTGIYWIHFKANMLNSTTSQYLGIGIETTPDNSTYTEVANSYTNAYTGNAHSVVVTNIFFDVTNTSTHKVRFSTKNPQAGTNTVLSNSGKNITDVTFIRLGDT